MEIIAYWFNIINIDSDNDLALNKWRGIIWISSYWLYSPGTLPVNIIYNTLLHYFHCKVNITISCCFRRLIRVITNVS